MLGLAEISAVGSLADMSTTFVTTLLASSDSSAGSSILSFAFLPLILLAMYFFMIRPQRRRQREQALLQQSIAVGQEVVTSSGIFGTITGEDGNNRFWLEVDDDVQIRIARAAIQNVVTPDTDEESDTDDSDPFDAVASSED